MNQGRDAWIELARGQAALYRSINMKAQNVEVGLVRAAKSEATTAIGRARQKLAKLDTAGLVVDGQIVSDAVKAVEDYAAAALQAASFVEEDAFNATMFMTDAEQKFAAAEGRFRVWSPRRSRSTMPIDKQMAGLMMRASPDHRWLRGHCGAGFDRGESTLSDD